MIFLNADLGESWYGRTVGNDAALMSHLDLCNIACGFHGGDVATQRRALELAGEHGVRIGAHPSFPDRKNFGRVIRDLPDDQLLDMLLYQVAGLQALAERSGQKLFHLKPHGALYHYANRRSEVAAAVITVAKQLGIGNVVGPPNGQLSSAARASGIPYLAEGFADRAYEPDLTLRDRSLPGALLETDEAVKRQVRQMLNAQVTATDGRRYRIEVDTVCLHGDHSGAVERARVVAAVLR